jgi:ABC-type glycerol-3-phosphate transport system permease component
MSITEATTTSRAPNSPPRKRGVPRDQQNPLLPQRANRSSRILRWIFDHAWVHLLLLTGIAIFLFPFVYMLATSLKTDEELTSTAWFPAIPKFQPASPYVRAAQPVAKPTEVKEQVWDAAAFSPTRACRD